jgi:NAD-dependent DNA ligase
MDLLGGIVADGVVTAEEFRILDQWLMQNSDLTREFPFNILARQLSEILADGRVEIAEFEKLHEVILQILHPLSLGCIDLSKVKETPMTQPPPHITFAERAFVFTGNFYFGEKSACEKATTSRGGLCKRSVTRATDYIVVGGKGSADWIYGSYGSKIEKAIDNVRSGCGTAIISEARWAQALDRISSEES